MFCIPRLSSHVANSPVAANGKSPSGANAQFGLHYKTVPSNREHHSFLRHSEFLVRHSTFVLPYQCRYPGEYRTPNKECRMPKFQERWNFDDQNSGRNRATIQDLLFVIMMPDIKHPIASTTLSFDIRLTVPVPLPRRISNTEQGRSNAEMPSVLDCTRVTPDRPRNSGELHYDCGCRFGLVQIAICFRLELKINKRSEPLRCIQHECPNHHRRDNR